MATLNSPGALVTVIDESFYTPSAPGTVPLIFVASAANKSNASGTGTAPGTLAANAGKVWTITSQRDLTDTFGTPKFYTDTSGNPVHAGELNEYGLQAAYSLLGVSSRAYITRADIDLAQLVPAASVPTGDPQSGTYWVDTNDSQYGLGEWDKTNKIFVNKTPLVIDNDNKDTTADLAGDVLVPKASFGSKGDYAIVVSSQNTNQLWFKNADSVWVVVGSNKEENLQSSVSTFASTAWQTSWPVVTSTGFGTVSTASVQFSINGTAVTLGTDVSVTGVAESINSAMYTLGVGAKVLNGNLALFADATAKSDGVTADGNIILDNLTDGVLSSLGLTAGQYGGVKITIDTHTRYPQYGTGKNATGSVYVKTTTPNLGANWAVKLYNGTTQSWGTVSAPIYSTSAAAIYDLDKAGGKNIPAGTLYIESNYDHGTGNSVEVGTSTVQTSVLAEFKIYRRVASSPTTITATPTVSTFSTGTAHTFQIKETLAGSISGNANFSDAYTVTIPAGATMADAVAAVSASAAVNVEAAYNEATNTFTLSHKLGGDFKLLDGNNNPLAALGFSAYNMTTKTGTANLYATGLYEEYGVGAEYALKQFTLRASNWKPLVYEAKADAPYTAPADGQLWYSSVVDEVDIMYHNGSTWVGYRDATAFPNTDSNGPIVSALAPTQQVGGHNGVYDLVDGDIWISTASIENYGNEVYVWDQTAKRWIAQDVTDQTTPNGWLFADARWSTTGADTDPAAIKTLLTSNYLDPDAPDPALYPQGMRLWNLRRSGFNVKKYVQNHINIYANDGKNARFNDQVMTGSVDPVIAEYNPDRWITVSPNQETGAGSFGRHAQRGFVVSAFKALIDTNEAVRDTDTLVFNLIACPGYPEAIQNMVAFNVDRGQTAFVVGDTPFRLAPTGTELSTWGNNVNLAFDNGDAGAVSYDEYMAMFYPSGFTNDNTGNSIVVPASHMMLRTIANSDAKSYQWFAPAGTRRGGIDNASSVGYVKDGEFKTVALYEGLRDVLAGVKINPIATFPGAGLVNFGNYTRARNASALDRINVARLVVYLRRQLSILARPFLFEPNDRITRNEIKAAAESLLLELVGQRALYDFIVVCDESNNTNARIDRSELWMDIAIEPVKAVEFIYIPLRLKNTGDIKAGL
jgi:hypothetical protein